MRAFKLAVVISLLIVTSVAAQAGLSVVSPASTTKRVALVIGNSHYANVPELATSANDAVAIASMLTELGFESVTTAIDVDLRSFQDKIREFTRALNGAEIAFFFYSGHGLQVDGRNYLVPVDARVETNADVDFETIPLDLIVQLVERSPRNALYFFDAAHPSPFLREGTRSLSRGLARVEPGLGSLISFSAEPGTVSLSADGAHSLYVQALLKYLPVPDLEISLAMRKVRDEVRQASAGQQSPYVFSSLTAEGIYLGGKREPNIAEPIIIEKTISSEQIEARDEVNSAEEAFSIVREIGECHAYRAFVERFSETFYADIARAYLEENCGHEVEIASLGSQAIGRVEQLGPERNRLALLIGNQEYVEAVGPLKNPHNDIRILGAALSKARFNVMEPVEDATRKEIRQAVREYGQQLGALGKDAIGFFYYSGHGAAETETGPNYLIPVDATSIDGYELWDDSVALSWVVDTLKKMAPEAAHFIVFDACRNELKRSDYRNSVKGFVPLTQEGGIFIAFSTAPGTRALDGDGSSGPYAAALAKQIVTPDQHHLDIFQSTKEEVYEVTGHRQTPWERNGLLRRIVFLHGSHQAN